MTDVDKFFFSVRKERDNFRFLLSLSQGARCGQGEVSVGGYCAHCRCAPTLIVNHEQHFELFSSRRHRFNWRCGISQRSVGRIQTRWAVWWKAAIQVLWTSLRGAHRHILNVVSRRQHVGDQSTERYVKEACIEHHLDFVQADYSQRPRDRRSSPRSSRKLGH